MGQMLSKRIMINGKAKLFHSCPIPGEAKATPACSTTHKESMLISKALNTTLQIMHAAPFTSITKLHNHNVRPNQTTMYPTTPCSQAGHHGIVLYMHVFVLWKPSMVHKCGALCIKQHTHKSNNFKHANVFVYELLFRNASMQIPWHKL